MLSSVEFIDFESIITHVFYHSDVYAFIFWTTPVYSSYKNEWLHHSVQDMHTKMHRSRTKIDKGHFDNGHH